LNQFELASLHFRLSGALRAQGKLKDSEEMYLEGITLNERLIVDFPKVIRHKEQYATRLQTLARQYETDRQTQKAGDIHDKLLTAREKLVSACPDVLQHKRDLANSYTRLGNTYRSAKQWQKASETMARIVVLRTQILEASQYAARDRQTLANRLYLWAKDLSEMQQHELAVEKLKESLNHYQAIKNDRQLQGLVVEHGNAWMQLGYEQLTLKHMKKAHEAFLNALPYRIQMYESGKTLNNRNTLAKCHFMLFQTYWYVKYDVLGAARHYVLSSVLDPVYCKPPVDPVWLIKTAWLLNKISPRPASVSSPANRK